MKITPFLISLLWLAGLVRADEDWRMFRTPTGQMVEARILSTGLQGVELELKEGGQQVTVPFERLSPADLNHVQDWSLRHPENRPAEPRDPGEAEPALNVGSPYPRTFADVEKLIETVLNRDAPAGLDYQVQKAVNELNVYRLLCGVPWKVLPDEGIAESAERAAKTFMEQGENSREVDELRERFLFEEGEEDMEQVVPEFIGDEKRDHRKTMPLRARMLNPRLSRTGFGIFEKVVAVRADEPGGDGPEFWTYPGRGYFPHERLHGDQWSLYVNYRIPDDADDRVVVEVTQLSRAPEAGFALDEPVPGAHVEIRDVFVHKNAVHFRPAKPEKEGIYWVRVTGQGLEVQYVVHFY